MYITFSIRKLKPLLGVHCRVYDLGFRDVGFIGFSIPVIGVSIPFSPQKRFMVIISGLTSYNTEFKVHGSGFKDVSGLQVRT